MTPKQGLAFVATHGIVLESAQGPCLNLAEAVAVEPIRGSYWSHAKANEIFLCSRAIRKSADVLVCRLVEGKVTYVYRRLWPALVRLAPKFDAGRLAAIREVHTASGKHVVEIKAYPDWVSNDVKRAAEKLSLKEATTVFSAVLKESPPKKSRKSRQTI